MKTEVKSCGPWYLNPRNHKIKALTGSAEEGCGVKMNSFTLFRFSQNIKYKAFFSQLNESFF